MTIPPIPSQDLAKLVLGYLAEEQLMTAYDEFLQTSPYLDALGNEYDRIFMTSLRNILAEYRAVKIYVETCKPFALRRKMFQCTNLLEMVKLLIQYVDINKIQLQENVQSKYSFERQSSVNTHISTSSTESSVETTALADLPGNHVTCRKKNVRILNKDLSELNTDVIESTSKLQVNNEVPEKTLTNSTTILSQMAIFPDTPQNICVSEKPESLEMKQKEEFNDILNQVRNKNEHVDTNTVCQYGGIDEQNKVSMGGYDAFATGVNSGGNGANINVPDSSTSENVHVPVPATKETNKLTSIEQSAKVIKTKTQYLLKVANIKNKLTIQPKDVVSLNTVNNCVVPRTNSKTDESKVKILSDVKVVKTCNHSEASTSNMPKIPTVLRNTSTPVVQMQTQCIVINGTPVYKNKQYPPKSFTKDEIMAMPTIILAPAPAPHRVPVSQPAETVSDPKQYVPKSSSRTFSPLIIDVTSTKNPTNTSNQNVEEQQLPPIEETNKEVKQDEHTNIKSGDIISASAPKDNSVTGTTETSTPQLLPPVRKTASTPRRSSHVRVLDFTTPRRVLHETINKCVSHLTLDCDKEVVLSKSPISIPVTVGQVEKDKLEECNTSSLKENSNKKKINKRWDADLRVLATVSERDDTNAPPSPKKKSKPRSSRKSKVSKDQMSSSKVEKTKTDKTNTKKKTTKNILPEKQTPSDDVEIITIPDDKIPIKPTIKIIPGSDHCRNTNTSSENNKSQNKSHSEDNIDTPEMERISLQNEIGAKLNISDLLETPYKQALYDIQMETPRFLGPDIPDDPMSDIKIMNIPTPRFLATAATPSSYSSRPTDYSSGGSYYKPEDQDYMRVHDELDCAVTSTKESENIYDSNDKVSDDFKEKENLKPSRPVRKCTKNVSYYNVHTGKTKQADNKTEIDSSTDSASTDDGLFEKVMPNTPVTPKIKDIKNKSDISKKGSSKRRKTPVKKEVIKSFMKIKPRRPTPIKNIVKSRRKTIDPASSPKGQTKKKASNKENSANITPVINSAPTKSRRKSSTPRKLHCSKSFHTESSARDSPEVEVKSKEKVPETNVQDSDAEQLPLRWSDDGSQEPQTVVISIPNDPEDIKHIKEYIETSGISNKPVQKEVSLHIDLVQRGFDLETAKSIERDLLDTPLVSRKENAGQEQVIISAGNTAIETEKIIPVESKIDDTVLEKTLESDCSNQLQIVQNDEEVDEEIELCVHESNEDSTNYFTCSHDDTKELPKTEVTLLKDKFSMELCIDDGVTIRLRATPFSLLFDQDSQTVEHLNYSYRETEMAVNSISNFDKLYTPLKESVKAQCYEIFDSTLTSLDTPLKVRSPKKADTEVTITEIVLEVEKVDETEKMETKKRKRVLSGNISDEGTESKKVKPDTQLLFKSTNIQNFDIDSVLSKLHGP